MNISFTSLRFRTLSLLFLSSIIFIVFIVLIAKQTFTHSYTYLIKEEMNSIMQNVSPKLAISLTEPTQQNLYLIANNELKNKNILLIKIDSIILKEALIFTKQKKSIIALKNEGNFVSTQNIVEKSTSTQLGVMILVYSDEAHKAYMQKFYTWFIGGVLIFALAISLLGFFLYNALKRLSTLALFFEKFNPSKPELLSLNSTTYDEIDIISKSANKMIKNLIKYTKNTKRLNEEVRQQQNHLNEAQRIAKVGSWEYDLISKKLLLSNEVYRILRIKLGTLITWKDFLNFISKEDKKRVVSTVNDAIKHGSKFNIKYAVTLGNNDQIYIRTRGKVRKKAGGHIKITAVSIDITNDIKNKKMIEKLAYYDSLTGLANRTLLKDRMLKSIQYAKRQKTNLAVIFLDLDHFKLINDTLGHSVGDELLIYIAKLLKTLLRESDTLSRLGGDEFVILLPSINSYSDAQNIAHKIQQALQNKHDIGTHQLYITSSIGVSIYPEHGKDSDELIRNADTAMYESKNNGRNSYKIYSNLMGNLVDEQLNLEQDLIQAIKNKTGIEVYYQAKIDAKNNFISGAEALVRWNHPKQGLIFPDSFIHVAESTGLMIDLGNMIIEESIFQLQEWNKLGLVGLKIAINLSPRQFQDSNLLSFVSSMIKQYQVDPSQIEFEITETLSMKNTANTLRILTQLKEIGVSIAIDDFGTGHSSLAYLKKFPINTLKIDKSFVMDIIEDEEDKIIVEAIISMSHSLGFITVAEGVETLEHVKMLQNMGCDRLQGYYFSRPIPKDEFIRYLKDYIPN